MMIALAGARVFDGETIRENAAVLVRDRTVLDIVPEREVPSQADLRDLGGGLLAPGFIDLQVNGGAGVMLNDGPSPAGHGDHCRRAPAVRHHRPAADADHRHRPPSPTRRSRRGLGGRARFRGFSACTSKARTWRRRARGRTSPS